MADSSAYVGKGEAMGNAVMGNAAMSNAAMSNAAMVRATIRARLENCPFVVGFGAVLAGFSSLSYVLAHVAIRLLTH